MRYTAYLFFLILSSAPTFAQVPQGTFGCGIAERALEARQMVSESVQPVELSVQGSTFIINGADDPVTGSVDTAPISDVTITEDGGPLFAGQPVFELSLPDGNSFARLTQGTDSTGVPVAYLRLSNGNMHMACVQQGAQSSELQQEDESNQPSLTDEQKMERRLSITPLQQGRERTSFGPVVKTAPEQGYYECYTTKYGDDGSSAQEPGVGDLRIKGFDLYADGTLRLNHEQGFDEVGQKWKSNTTTGAVLFEGTLGVYFKFPVHVRKQLPSLNAPAGLFYQTMYDGLAISTLSICVQNGPAQKESPAAELAKKSAANLAPPPPSGNTFTGLYQNSQLITSYGINNTINSYTVYDYRYFQDNGYVWLDSPPADGDFSKLQCDKPMVDEDGDPLCTTYAVEDGLLSSSTIRIGTDQQVSFELEDDSVTIDGTGFIALKGSTGLTLNKVYSYFRYDGLNKSGAKFAFTDDGRFQYLAESGRLFFQQNTGAGHTATTTITGDDPDVAMSGTYAIENNSITLTADSGEVKKMFFAFITDGLIIIGDDSYTDLDN
jgi:hypothetical protein